MNKKNSICIATIFVILISSLNGCGTNEQKPQKIPGIHTEKSVNLGEEFTLAKGQSAIIKDLNVSLKIIDFIYSPCQKGSQCFWSGLAVVYELSVNGKVYVSSLGNSIYGAPYDIFIKKTDYKTFATFVIDNPENRCIKNSGISQDECWRELAKRFNDESYCSKIQTLITKDACYEDLAEKLNNGDTEHKVL